MLAQQLTPILRQTNRRARKDDQEFVSFLSSLHDVGKSVHDILVFSQSWQRQSEAENVDVFILDQRVDAGVKDFAFARVLLRRIHRIANREKRRLDLLELVQRYF